MSNHDPIRDALKRLVDAEDNYPWSISDHRDNLAAARAAALHQAQATELTSWRSRAALVPVPVAERPWEREGWCDDEGQCWILNRDGRTWRLVNCEWMLLPGDLRYRWLLPHWAIAQPSQAGEVEP